MSLTLPSPLPAFPSIIDSTILTSFRSCPRKFAYSFLHNLRPPGKSVHLTAGAAFAAGSEAARLFAFSTPDPVSVDELLEAAFPSFCSEWGDWDPEPHPLLAKTFVNTFDALAEYLTEFHPQKDSIQPLRNGEGKPFVEFTYAIPLPVLHPTTHEPLIFAGRFDLLGHFTEQPDLLCIIDEKTTSALGQSWLKQWDLRGQFLGYCWACRELGYPISHVFVRGVAIKKTETSFLTAPIQFPSHLLDLWYENTLFTLRQAVDYYQQAFFPFNFGETCASYGGCLYTPLCLSPDPERWFTTFEVQPWSPLKPGV